MKQHITDKQLKEVIGKGYQRLYEWATKFPRNYTPNLSIGQMIEFLDEHWIKLEQEFDKDDDDKGEFTDRCLYRCADGCWHVDDPVDNNQGEHFELCDALWEAVKEVLEK